MTILLSGAFNPRFAALPEYLAAALRRLGHRVALFDHRAFLLPGRLRDRYAGLAAFDRGMLNRRFLRAVRRHRPELVLVNQGMVIEPRTIERARGLGARCVNWFSDYPAEFEAGLAAAPAYDAFHLASSYAAERHRLAGLGCSDWLPFGCDPEVHRPAEAPAADGGAAVVFVGSWYPERQILLRFLRGLPVGVWGPGWERAKGDPHLAPMLRGEALRPAEWRALYGGARVVLNIHYGCFGPREVGGDLANTRVFEILACGAYQVVDRQGDVLRLFRDGEHLAVFSSGDELRARVEEALRDEGRTAAVAARGRAAVLAGHTYVHRARRLVEQGAVRGQGPAGVAGAVEASPAARAAGGSSR